MDLRGTFVALYTPFAEDGGVDVDALRALCERVVAAGSGLVPCGTTGETPNLSVDEYCTVVKHAVDVADGRVPVIAGTGSNNTAAAIQTTRLARDLGADAALVVTPYYNRPPQEALRAHFELVADEGGLPIMLYNVPSRTGVNMTAETSLALAAHPKVVAVKEASGDLGQIHALIAGAPEGFRVLSGDDAWTLPLCALGGDGVVSVAGNVVPAQMVGLTAAALEGDLTTARELNDRLRPLFRALFATTNPVPVKRAAALLGHARPNVRLPLMAGSCSEAITAALEAALAQATA